MLKTDSKNIMKKIKSIIYNEIHDALKQIFDIDFQNTSNTTKEKKFTKYDEWETEAKNQNYQIVYRQDDVLALLPDKTRVGKWDNVFHFGILYF